MREIRLQWHYFIIFFGTFVCFIIDYYLLHYTVITKTIIFSAILVVGIAGTLFRKFYKRKMDVWTFLAYNYFGFASCVVTFLLLLNFWITPGDEQTEAYGIFAHRVNSIRDPGRSEGTETEVVIILNNFAYANYVNIRAFDYADNYSAITLSNTVRFYFKRGLLGFKVLKGFEFFKK